MKRHVEPFSRPIEDCTIRKVNESHTVSSSILVITIMKIARNVIQIIHRQVAAWGERALCGPPKFSIKFRKTYAVPDLLHRHTVGNSSRFQEFDDGPDGTAGRVV